MRNVLIVVVVCAVALLVFLRSRNITPPPAVVPSANTVQKTEATPEKAAAKPIRNPGDASANFAKGEIMNALRAAFGPPRNDEALETAYAALLAYINAHPEQVADYVNILRTETHEQVLRRFSFAIAESEVGLQANDEIIQAAIEMAKDRTIEQRQHIMLYMMSRFPDMRDDVHEAVRELARTDPNPQVRNSALSVMADWMEAHPDQVLSLLDDVEKVYETTDEDEVRAYTYQLFGLHTEKLPEDLHRSLFDRLKTEPDSFNCNLIAAALIGAPMEIKADALAYVQKTFDAEADVETRRNLLLQIVCLSGNDALPLLEKHAKEGSPLATDAAAFAKLLARGEGVEPFQLFEQRAIIDTKELPEKGHDDHAEEKMRAYEEAKAIADKNGQKSVAP